MLDARIILHDYQVCALWSSLHYESEVDDNPVPMDSVVDTDDIAPETADAMLLDLEDFVALLDTEGIDWAAIMTPAQFGHDFWLTRNGHGAGFWDRGYGDIGDALTKWAHSMGSVDLYISDDGLVYQA